MLGAKGIGRQVQQWGMLSSSGGPHQSVRMHFLLRTVHPAEATTAMMLCCLSY